eukprot:scaffold1850_cov96-Isochrysis_galbana.AAC.3
MVEYGVQRLAGGCVRSGTSHEKSHVNVVAPTDAASEGSDILQEGSDILHMPDAPDMSRCLRRGNASRA